MSFFSKSRKNNASSHSLDDGVGAVGPSKPRRTPASNAPSQIANDGRGLLMSISGVLNDPKQSRLQPRLDLGGMLVASAAVRKVKLSEFDAYLKSITGYYDRYQYHRILGIDRVTSGTPSLHVLSVGAKGSATNSRAKTLIGASQSASAPVVDSYSNLYELIHGHPPATPIDTRASPQNPQSPLLPVSPATPDSQSLDLVPKVFFESDFSLENPRVFDQVTEHLASLSSSSSSSSANANITTTITLLQEKMSHYLDTAELHLVKEISDRSASFFAALSNLQALHSETAACVSKIGELRTHLARVAETHSQQGLQVIRLKQRQFNMSQLYTTIKTVAEVRAAQPMIQVLLHQGDYVGALDLIGEANRVLKGNHNNTSIINRSQSIERDLRGVKALTHFSSQLTEMSKTIAMLMQNDFIQLLVKDIHHFIDHLERKLNQEKLKESITSNTPLLPPSQLISPSTTSYSSSRTQFVGRLMSLKSTSISTTPLLPGPLTNQNSSSTFTDTTNALDTLSKVLTTSESTGLHLSSEQTEAFTVLHGQLIPLVFGLIRIDRLYTVLQTWREVMQKQVKSIIKKQYTPLITVPENTSEQINTRDNTQISKRKEQSTSTMRMIRSMNFDSFLRLLVDVYMHAYELLKRITVTQCLVASILDDAESKCIRIGRDEIIKSANDITASGSLGNDIVLTQIGNGQGNRSTNNNNNIFQDETSHDTNLGNTKHNDDDDDDDDLGVEKNSISSLPSSSIIKQQTQQSSWPSQNNQNASTIHRGSISPSIVSSISSVIPSGDTSSSPTHLAGTSYPFSSPSSYQQRRTECFDSVFQLINLAHIRVAKLVAVRADQNAQLNPKDFHRLFGLTWGFLVESEQLLGYVSNVTNKNGGGENMTKICFGLRGSMVAQTKSFMNHFHMEKTKQLTLLIENEQWMQADVLHDFQLMFDRIVAAAMFDAFNIDDENSIIPQTLLARRYNGNNRAANSYPQDTFAGLSDSVEPSPTSAVSTSSNNAGLAIETTPSSVAAATAAKTFSKTIMVGFDPIEMSAPYNSSTRFYVVGCLLMFAKTLVDYLQCAARIPNLSTEVLQKLCEILKMFNSRVCQVVLGAGAMRSAGLKNITAKHLALAAQSLGAVAALIPYIKTLLAHYVPVKHGVLLADLDKVAKDFHDHKSEIYTKLVSIMQERALVYCKSIPTTDWDAPLPSGPNPDLQPSTYIEQLVKETTTLHRVLSKYLPIDVVKTVMSEIFVGYNAKLEEGLKKLDIFTSVAKNRLLFDAQFYIQKLSVLDDIDGPGNHLEVVVNNMRIKDRRSISKQAGSPALVATLTGKLTGTEYIGTATQPLGTSSTTANKITSSISGFNLKTILQPSRPLAEATSLSTLSSMPNLATPATPPQSSTAAPSLSSLSGNVPQQSIPPVVPQASKDTATAARDAAVKTKQMASDWMKKMSFMNKTDNP